MSDAELIYLLRIQSMRAIADIWPVYYGPIQ